MYSFKLLEKNTYFYFDYKYQKQIPLKILKSLVSKKDWFLRLPYPGKRFKNPKTLKVQTNNM